MVLVVDAGRLGLGGHVWHEHTGLMERAEVADVRTSVVYEHVRATVIEP